jgi:hypothetical protein
MSSTKYPKIPSSRSQLTTAAVIMTLCIGALCFINPDLHFQEATKRILNRSGALLLLGATILGAFGFIWAKKNRKKAALAKRDIAECVEAIRRMTDGQQDCTAVEQHLAETRQKKADAESAIEEASNFEDEVATVAIGALVFAATGTILLVLAA